MSRARAAWHRGALVCAGACACAAFAACQLLPAGFDEQPRPLPVAATIESNMQWGIRLEYPTGLDTNLAPGAAGFTLRRNGAWTNYGFMNVTGAARTLTVWVNDPFFPGETVSIAYDGTGFLQTWAGHWLWAFDELPVVNLFRTN